MIIPPIEINSSDITSQFDISEKDLETMFDNVAKGLAVVYYAKLEMEAINNLHSTRATYIRNILLVDSGKLEGTVLLDYSKEPLVQMLEEGASPFDMKTGLLNSPKAKVGKNGKKYITVPFRLATSDAVGESEVFSGRMPADIETQAKKLEITQSGSSRGLPLSALPDQYQIKKKRPEITDSEGKVLFKEYEHKTAIYQGIIKTTDSNTAQGAYFSFRRVSENSPAEAFIHPGFPTLRLMEKAYAAMNLPEEVGIQIDNELAKLGFNG